VSQLLYLLQPVGHFKFLFHQLFVGLGLNLGLPTHTAYLKSTGAQAFTDDGLAL
jgi:hypothetical protein